MCRLPRVVLVAPAADHERLRRELSSISYELVGTYEQVGSIEVDADVALIIGPREEHVAELHDRGFKVAALGGAKDDADLVLDADDIAGFRSRFWELFRPS